MVCHPCQEAGKLSTAAYRRRVTREGPTYRERLKGHMACGECGELLAAGSLSIHIMNQHGRAAEIRWQWSNPTAGTGTQTYRMASPAKGGPRKCPVARCPGRVETRTAMRVNFVHRHVLNIVVIMEEGSPPLHPRCAQCEMLVPRRALNGQHPETAQCAKGAEQKRQRLSEAETQESSERASWPRGSL